MTEMNELGSCGEMPVKLDHASKQIGSEHTVWTITSGGGEGPRGLVPLEEYLRDIAAAKQAARMLNRPTADEVYAFLEAHGVEVVVRDGYHWYKDGEELNGNLVEKAVEIARAVLGLETRGGE